MDWVSVVVVGTIIVNWLIHLRFGDYSTNAPLLVGIKHNELGVKKIKVMALNDLV